jgi:hypothetical protein
MSNDTLKNDPNFNGVPIGDIIKASIYVFSSIVQLIPYTIILWVSLANQWKT